MRPLARLYGLSTSLIVMAQTVGELIDKAEKQRRLEEQAQRGIMDFYMMEHSSGVIIDARLKGNLARLINSSCDPNCITQKWHDAATNEACSMTKECGGCIQLPCCAMPDEESDCLQSKDTVL